MGFDIGPKIGIEGEAEFKKAITSINTDLKVLSSEMTKTTSAFLSNADSIESLTAKSNVYEKQIGTQKTKINELKSALDNAKVTYGENSDQVKKWQIQLNNAESDLSKMENSLQDTKSKIQQFGNGTEQASSELKQYANESKNSASVTGILSEASENLGNKLGIPIDKLKMLPAGAVAATAAIAGVAIGCYKLIDALMDAGKQAGEFADNILTLSAKTHTSAQELQQYAYYAELVDVPLETVSTSLGKLTKSMASAQSGSGAQADAFKQLGVSVTDANGNLRDANDVFADAIDAIGKVGNETEADAIASQIFGKSFQELNPLVAVGSEKMKEFAEEAKKWGLICPMKH
jgi:methyl-accepting chemotaxis protein